MSLPASTPSNETVSTDQAVATSSAPALNRSEITRDSGRVRVGGAFIRFDGVKDLGRVRVGGAFMRF